MSCSEMYSHQSTDDHFDRLPSSLILLIFNKLQDVKTLGRCCAVSKRFNSLVPQIDTITVKVDCVISNEDAGGNYKSKGLFGNLAKFLLGSIFKPIQVLHQIFLPKKAVEVSHHSPEAVLKNFKEIRFLQIVLPNGDFRVEGGALLKWKAEFGRSLESCVILGATSFWENPEFGNNSDSVEEQGSTPESFCTNGGLKLRVLWTITSLIAASARHYLLQEMVSDHPTLQSIVLTDADEQGMLCMGKEQIAEFRHSPVTVSTPLKRTQVPALNMKLWYAPRLELQSGYVLDGATLVSIRPVDRPDNRDHDAFVVDAFDGPFGEAAKAMVKRRTYLLEMNPF